MAGPASHPVYERGFIGLRVLSEHVEHNADPSAIAPDLPKYHGDGAPAHIARCAAIEKEGHRGAKSLAEKTQTPRSYWIVGDSENDCVRVANADPIADFA
jgi:hypothetical protein